MVRMFSTAKISCLTVDSWNRKTKQNKKITLSIQRWFCFFLASLQTSNHSLCGGRPIALTTHWRRPSSQTHLISYPRLLLHTSCTHVTGRPKSWCPSSCDRSAKPLSQFKSSTRSVIIVELCKQSYFEPNWEKQRNLVLWLVSGCAKRLFLSLSHVTWNVA